MLVSHKFCMYKYVCVCVCFVNFTISTSLINWPTIGIRRVTGTIERLHCRLHSHPSLTTDEAPPEQISHYRHIIIMLFNSL